jgi:hypothetical protein
MAQALNNNMQSAISAAPSVSDAQLPSGTRRQSHPDPSSPTASKSMTSYLGSTMSGDPSLDP